MNNWLMLFVCTAWKKCYFHVLDFDRKVLKWMVYNFPRNAMHFLSPRVMPKMVTQKKQKKKKQKKTSTHGQGSKKTTHNEANQLKHVTKLSLNKLRTKSKRRHRKTKLINHKHKNHRDLRNMYPPPQASLSIFPNTLD